MKRYPPELRAEQGQPVTHTHHEFDAAGPATPVPPRSGGSPAAQGDSEELLATLGYLGVIFFSFLPALVIFAARGRSSRYLRYHAAQAANLSITVILFNLSAFIVAAMLALDTVEVSLIVVMPLATALWLTTLAYLIRTALATARGEPYELPGWLCVQVLK
jgi:uncharacterized Tic20 family protein